MRSINPRTGLEMSPNETIIYDVLCEAARDGLLCPFNLDLDMLIGCSSSSGGSTVVRRLEERGLIVVDTSGQRFRRVQIVATGEWTMKDPRQKCMNPHRPRRKASMPPPATDRKPYKARV